MAENSAAGRAESAATGQALLNSTAWRELARLARWYGIQLTYRDMAGRQQSASPDTLKTVLASMGVPVPNEAAVSEAWRHAQQSHWTVPLDPVTVVWTGGPSMATLRLPDGFPSGRAVLRIRSEDGQEQMHPIKRLSCKRLRTARIEGAQFALDQVQLPTLPEGYHQLELQWGSKHSRSLLIAAPPRTYSDPAWKAEWGLFLPLYALHSKRSWGSGNWTDWQELAAWMADLGGRLLGTLPLLASFLDGPAFEPSPYSPASRLFWNEFYLDIEAIPEVKACAPVQRLLRSRSFRARLGRFQAADLIDYRAQMGVRREILELLSDFFFSQSGPRHEALRKFLRERPEVVDYARFRAVLEQQNCAWPKWPSRLRDGTIRSSDYSQPLQDYHCFVQWLATQQIGSVRGSLQKSGVKLYLDLPLGVHPAGYDTWRHRGAFALEANAGAPPDPCFTKGQDWGFPPLHPHRIREHGYRYLLEYLRFQLAHTDVLRIDHVMGLHRLYWVPKGHSPDQGAYVHSRADELYAILCLESHRHRAMIVGENLGTVPPEVNRSMKQRRLRGMFVVQYELQPKATTALKPPPSLSVASLNTHDMPTFRAYWEGKDMADRAELGLINASQLRQEKAHRVQTKKALIEFLRKRGWLKQRRRPTIQAVLTACLHWLGASSAEAVLVNLEDLWLEDRPQNVPGTSRERPNWRRPAGRSLEQFAADPVLVEFLHHLRENGGKRTRHRLSPTSKVQGKPHP